MAGSLAIVASEPLDNPPVAVNGNQWLVDFARFFTYPSLSSTHKSLVSLHTYNSSRQKQGTWLSTSSAAASLQIIKDQFTSDAILIICFRDKILVSLSFWIFGGAPGLDCFGCLFPLEFRFI